MQWNQILPPTQPCTLHTYTHTAVPVCVYAEPCRYLAGVVDEELFVDHPVVRVQAAVKELRRDIILDAVGLSRQLELQYSGSNSDGG